MINGGASTPQHEKQQIEVWLIRYSLNTSIHTFLAHLLSIHNSKSANCFTEFKNNKKNCLFPSDQIDVTRGCVTVVILKCMVAATVVHTSNWTSSYAWHKYNYNYILCVEYSTYIIWMCYSSVYNWKYMHAIRMCYKMCGGESFLGHRETLPTAFIALPCILYYIQIYLYYNEWMNVHIALQA